FYFFFFFGGGGGRAGGGPPPPPGAAWMLRCCFGVRCRYPRISMRQLQYFEISVCRCVCSRPLRRRMA
ncbi:hypothetical protein ACUTF1_28780, partial [Burkholderia pseudomallei]